jgi:hypothetical protein
MLDVTATADWEMLRQKRLLTVLDPLVFRAADAFLRGAPATGDEPLWEAISRNVDALAVFVDAVMLQDQLPVFDYSATWELELAGSAATLVELCNQDEELLVGCALTGRPISRHVRRRWRRCERCRQSSQGSSRRSAASYPPSITAGGHDWTNSASLTKRNG